MQRRTIAPISLVNPVLLADYLSAPSQTTADGSADRVNATNATIVSTTGADEVTADTDLTVVSTAVTATTDSTDKTRDTVADDVTTVRAALADTGIAENTIQTTSFNIYSEYDYGGQKHELLGYHATHTLRVGVAPDRADEVVDLAVGAGASEIRGVVFTFTGEGRTELREEALTRAVDSAEANAGSVTSAAGPTVTGVHTAAVGGSASPGPYPVTYTEDAARVSSGSTELSPGLVIVSATVQMVYEAESE